MPENGNIYTAITWFSGWGSAVASRTILDSCALRVYAVIMKNITLSAKEDAIEGARKIAAQKHSTLNAMFREWLEDVNGRQTTDENVASQLEALWKQTNYLRVGKHLSRDEMNER